MIETHRKNSVLKLAFSATTEIFKKERKLFNVILFVPLACISNFFGFYFVWLVVLFCFKKQVERLRYGASSIHLGLCAIIIIIG